MKTKIVNITRTITLKATVSMQVPVDVVNSELEKALIDEAAVFDLIDDKTDRHEAFIIDNDYDVVTVTGLATVHFPLSNPDVLASLKDDELIV